MRGLSRYVKRLIGILVVAALAIYVAIPSSPGLHLNILGLQINQNFTIHEGLDLQGGMQVLLQADVPAGTNVTADQMTAVQDIISRRVNALGVTEPLIQQAQGNRIIVELPGIKDPAQAIQTFGGTGLLEFVDAGSTPLQEGALVTTSLGAPTVAESGTVGTPTAQASPSAVSSPTAATSPTAGASPTAASSPTAQASPSASPTGQAAAAGTPSAQGTPGATPTAKASPTATPTPVYKTIMTGKDLTSATVTFNQYNQPQISFTLNSAGAKIFGDFTSANVGKYLAIVLDKRVISSPQIQTAITGGSGLITGQFTLNQAKSLAIQLQYGALPIPLKVVQDQTIGPTLGKDSVQQSIIAGIIGLAIVASFMIILYRLPGVLAVLALGIYAAVVFALFKLIPVTLTLPGIAGFILSVGMAVDANILIFERMKEELRSGRSLRASIEAGFSRAWTSIRDSNVSTIITCVILFWFGASFGASTIQGFALTLAIGVVVSMVTAIFVSRTFLHVVIDSGVVRGIHWYGYGIPEPPAPTPQWRPGMPRPSGRGSASGEENETEGGYLGRQSVRARRADGGSTGGDDR